MPEIFRLIGIAEVQIVSDGERPRARAGEVARGFGDGNFCAFARVERAIERIAVASGGQNFVGIADEIDGGIRARLHQCAGAHRVIILAIHPVFGSNRRVAQ